MSQSDSAPLRKRGQGHRDIVAVPQDHYACIRLCICREVRKLPKIKSEDLLLWYYVLSGAQHYASFANDTATAGRLTRALEKVVDQMDARVRHAMAS